MEVMIQAAGLVTAILAVRKIFGEKLHAYIRYGLWVLVALRLLVPVNLIDSPVSVLRIGNILEERHAEIPDIHEGIGGTSKMDGLVVAASEEPLPVSNGQAFAEDKKADIDGGKSIESLSVRQVGDGDMLTDGQADISEDMLMDEQAGISGSADQDLKNISRRAGNFLLSENGEKVLKKVGFILRIIWVGGSILVGSFLLGAQLRFRSRLYRMRKLCQSSKAAEAMQDTRNAHGALKLFRRKHAVSGRAARIPVYRVAKLESPCLVGIIHPAVYIGSDMKVGSNYFRYTVTHERVHYLHGDHIWAAVRAVLVTVYWFHPFVWIAAAASARDGEIACDYGTVRQLGEKDRIAYGTMLLELSRINGRKRMYSYGTMLRPGKSEMKERILRLAGGNGSRMSTGILVILLMLVVAGCAFTGASRSNSGAEADKAVEDESTLQGNGDGAERNGDDSAGAESFGGNPDTANGDDNRNADSSEDADLSGSESADDRDGSVDGITFDPDDTVSEQRQLSAVSAALSEDTVFGADGPWLDYAGGLGTSKNSIIIFHDYFGLVVFDLTSGEVMQSLDLACIDCHMTQGDNVCEVRVSNDGTIVWLHPRSRQYMFRYEVESNQLYQLPIVKSFEADLEAEDLFDHYTVTEEEYASWHSNYLYEEYKDEKGFHTTYINLYVPDKAEQRLGSLQCIWDDMVYVLCQDGIWPGDIGAEAEFPYRYDGAVELVMILYDEPCVYSRISDDYGSRVHPPTGDIMKHEGIDYAAEAGTDITAAADGVVYKQGYSEEYGIFVVLLHANGDMTYYCHCQEITVAEGEQVRRGDKIATVGNTGRSTGAHLHFALSRNGEFVDPAGSMRSAVEE